jgi:hypothetical protein
MKCPTEEVAVSGSKLVLVLVSVVAILTVVDIQFGHET